MSTKHSSGSVLTKSREMARLCVRLKTGDPIVIEAWGELDAGTGHLLTELVEHVVTGVPGVVVLDVTHTRTLSAEGWRVLRLAESTIVAAGGRVSLRGAPAGTGTGAR